MGYLCLEIWRNFTMCYHRSVGEDRGGLDLLPPYTGQICSPYPRPLFSLFFICLFFFRGGVPLPKILIFLSPPPTHFSSKAPRPPNPPLWSPCPPPQISTELCDNSILYYRSWPSLVCVIFAPSLYLIIQNDTFENIIHTMFAILFMPKYITRSIYRY